MTDVSTETGGMLVMPRRSYGTGFSVVLLYIFFVFAVFAGFASYLTRTELEAHLGNGGGATRGLDDLIYLIKREEALQRLINQAVSEIKDADARIDKAKQAIFALEEEQDGQIRNRGALAVRTLVHIRRGSTLWQAESSSRMDKLLNDPDHQHDLDRMRAALSITDVLLFSADADPDEVSIFNGHLTAAAQELDTLDARLREIGARMLGLQDDRDSALTARSWPQQQREQFQDELSALRTREPANSSNRARISALSQLYGGPLFLELVSMPTIFLTLIVTMAAGGLGTVVSYTRNLQSKERLEAREGGQPVFVDDLSRLFVGVGEGIAAALAIFLLAGAGMLVLTNGNGAGRNSEISPYTVAFIAFLSGFMAEHAFIRIQKTGKDLFAANKQQGKNEDTPKDATPSGEKHESQD